VGVSQCVAHGHRVTRRALASGLLLLGAVLCGCTTASGGTSARDATRSGAGSVSAVDAAVVLRLQSTGPAGRTPAEVARVAGAVGCVGYQPGPYVPAGPTWEIRLRIPQPRLAAAMAALRRFPGVYDVQLVPLSWFTATPSARPGVDVDRTPC